jgi:hypothetical protein
LSVPVFPDVEALTLRFLREHLPANTEYGTFVEGDYDGSHPLVIARRIGGYMRWPHLDFATMDVEVWSASREESHDLSQIVTGALMGTRVTGGPFVRVNVIAGLVYMVDDLTELHRWVMTFQISTRPERAR